MKINTKVTIKEGEGENEASRRSYGTLLRLARSVPTETVIKPEGMAS